MSAKSETLTGGVPESRAWRKVAGVLVIAYALVTLIPLVWIFLTGFKTPPDAIAYPPKVFFEPSLAWMWMMGSSPSLARSWAQMRLPEVRRDAASSTMTSGRVI